MPAPIWDQEVQFSKASVLFLKARTWFTSSTQSGIHFFDEQGNEGHLHLRLGKRHFLAVHFGYMWCVTTAPLVMKKRGGNVNNN